MAISITSVSKPGAIDASTRSTVARSEPVRTTKPERDAAVRDRNAGEAGRANGGGDAGHDFERDAGGLQGEGFLAAAAEHERIAALQAHHPHALTRGFDQQRSISGCGVCARPARLPTLMRNARVASAQTSAETSAS